MFKRILSAILLLLVLTACQPDQPAAEVQPETSSLKAGSYATYSPTLEQVECSYFNQDNLKYVLDTTNSTAECGNLIVPEDREQVGSPTIKIAYMIYKSKTSAPNRDPILFLWEDPSMQVEDSMRYPYFLQDLLKERDFVILDLRGITHSEPAFDCPEINKMYYQDIEADPFSDEVNRHLTDTWQACYDRWTATGVDFANYSTEDITADVEDLRQALGYERWNIFGVLYGARIAYQLMQTNPESVRSLVIDSSFPLNGSFLSGQAVNYERVLNLLFDNCASDEKCSQAFPDLEKEFFFAVDQLNSHPATVEVKDLNSGDRHQMTLTGERLVDLVVISMGYNVREFIPELPRMIYQVSKGEYGKLAELIGNTIPFYEPYGVGMNGRILCEEQILPMTPSQQQESNQAADPRISTYLNRQYELYYQFCGEVWKEFAGQKQPAGQKGSGSVPVLLLEGEQNHLVSPDSAKALAQGLGRTTYLEIPQTGVLDWMFGSNKSDCVKPILKAFIDDPAATLDTQCLTARSPTLWITLP